MNETTPSYYPSARHMVAHDNNGILRIQKKPGMELVISHDQLLDLGPSRKIQQPQLRCTTCKDTSGNTIFYRPYITLHTLLQDLTQDDPSSETCAKRRHSMDDTTTIPYQQNLFNTENEASQVQHIGGTTTTTKGDENSKDGDDDDDDDINTIHNDNMDDRIYSKHCSSGTDMESNYDDELDQQRWVIPKQQQTYVTLYNATDDCPLWSLMEQDGHAMTLISHQLPHKYTLMTTSTFSFVWDDDRTEQPLFPYQWQMRLAEDGTSLELLCEQYQPDQSTKKPIALLDNQGTRLVLFGNDDKAANLVGGGQGNSSFFATAEPSEAVGTAMAVNAEHGNPYGGHPGSMNPFRTTTQQDGSNNNNRLCQRKLDSLDTFLVLSGLLLYDLLGSQLCTLDSNDGTRGAMMTMMIERQQQALKEEDALFYEQYLYYTQQQQQQMNEDGFDTMDTDAPPTQYYSKQGLVNGGDGDDMSRLDKKGMNLNHRGSGSMRWSSAGSLKSLELDPGLWRCWWGYGCWWQWLPWCMPGGCCDCAYIKIRGVQRQRHHHRSRVTRRMQGWQQQEE